jgi:hypothetical protein
MNTPDKETLQKKGGHNEEELENETGLVSTQEVV